MMSKIKEPLMEASKEEAKEMVKSPLELYKRKKWTTLDKKVVFVYLTMHLFCLYAPFCFTWRRWLLGAVIGNLTGNAISVSFHRNLAHRSFKLPKWLEYSLAYCASHALQGDPIDWVSTHRAHHRFVDTERDPHSPIYGFWFSQMTWFFDSYNLTRKVCPNYFKNYEKVERNRFVLFLKHGIPDNVGDLEKQAFYRFMRKTYLLHPIALSLLLYAFGGFPLFIYGMCVRFVLSLHITSMVNSVCHIWGKRPWNTPDLSRNNWMVALLTHGEGWHNNHHAFEYSARLGLEWWQIDYGWYVIKLLQIMGLATNVKLPSHNQKIAALNRSKSTLLNPITN